MSIQFRNFPAACLVSLVLLSPGYSQTAEEKKATPLDIAKAEAFSSLEKDALREWIKGPVRYIALFDDEAEYKNLKTDTERLYFIYRFWQKRDPTPWTMKNEFRLQFWDRVRTANTLFTDTTKPGWKTDRGMIYILLGPPDEIEPIAKVDYSFRTGDTGGGSKENDRLIADTDRTGRASNPFRDTAESGHRGLERWIYRSRKEFTEPNVVIPFYINESGEYILSQNPAHYTKGTPYLKLPDYGLPNPLITVAGSATTLYQQIDKEVERNITLNQMMQAKSDISQAVDIASGEEILKEVVKTIEYYEPLKGNPEFNYFPSLDNKSYVLITIDYNLQDMYEGNIPADTIIPLAMFGKAKSGDHQAEYIFSSDDLAPRHIVRDGNKISVMASFSASPGKYTIAGGLQEMVSGKILSFQKNIEVPDLENCTLGISTYVLARSISEKKTRPDPLPFGMNVIPKIDSEFHRNEDFGVYYQVCGLGIDKETAKQDYDVSYQFYRKDKDKLVKLGKPVVFPDRHEAEEGWSFPLSKWPSGEYLLEIEIYDKINNQKATSSISFTVLD